MGFDQITPRGNTPACLPSTWAASTLLSASPGRHAGDGTAYSANYNATTYYLNTYGKRVEEPTSMLQRKGDFGFYFDVGALYYLSIWTEKVLQVITTRRPLTSTLTGSGFRILRCCSALLLEHMDGEGPAGYHNTKSHYRKTCFDDAARGGFQILRQSSLALLLEHID